MAKRVRGSTRPGQRARLQRSGPTRPRLPDPAPSPPASALTAAEEARAAELEAQILAAERAVEPTAVQTRGAGRSPEVEARVRPGSIALRAAEEYAYVSRDVRKIILIGGFLLALLFAIYAIIQTTGAGPF